MKKRVQQGLFTALFAALCLPAVQHLTALVQEDGLKGYFTVATDTTITVEGWYGSTYQQKKDLYLNDHTGFRAGMIRVKDQLDYSLYNRLDYGGAVPGKEHCLFFSNYIFAYTGEDHWDDSIMMAKMTRLKKLQDTFTSMGKSLVLIYAPNKAYYYADLLPDDWKQIKGATNYQRYLHTGDSLGIHQLDFNAWFVAMKDTCKEMLFTKAGTHWSVYGSVLAGDSLVRYIEHTRNMQLVHPKWAKVDHVYTARETDDDIENTANLLWRVDNERYAYPVLSYPEDTTHSKPKVIMIGDSFGFNLLYDGIPQHTFADWEFWFCFRYINNKHTQIGGNENNPLIANYNWLDAIEHTDCIVMLYTSISLTTGRGAMGHGFIEQAYDHYFPAKAGLASNEANQPDHQ